MASKQQFAGQAITLANVFSQLANNLEDLNSVFFDRGYNVGGADPIIDADVDSLNIKAADISGLITIAQQVDNVFGLHDDSVLR